MDFHNVTKRPQWDKSYSRRENFIFSPSDEVVRFISRYLRKRIGFNEIVDVSPNTYKSKVLDIGCGIGRHIHFGVSMQLDMYGVELSSTAVSVAHDWIKFSGLEIDAKNIHCGDIRQLPWPNDFFDHALSDSVLDSMNFSIACESVNEICRVMKSGGLLYCSLISKRDESGDIFFGEHEVLGEHEMGTVQSYFDEQKIRDLFASKFSFMRLELHSNQDVLNKVWSGRWHVVMKKI
jgi:SAM-dependent methyltransferase